MVGLEPNVVAYGAAMSALANGKQWQLALALLDEVRSTSVFVLSPACIAFPPLVKQSFLGQ